MTSNLVRLVRAALIAGIYVALCLVLQPLSYGPVQVRVSEALTLLPLFTPDAIWAAAPISESTMVVMPRPSIPGSSAMRWLAV